MTTNTFCQTRFFAFGARTDRALVRFADLALALVLVLAPALVIGLALALAHVGFLTWC